MQGFPWARFVYNSIRDTRNKRARDGPGAVRALEPGRLVRCDPQELGQDEVLRASTAGFRALKKVETCMPLRLSVEQQRARL